MAMSERVLDAVSPATVEVGSSPGNVVELARVADVEVSARRPV
jgi:hypothetical protein